MEMYSKMFTDVLLESYTESQVWGYSSPSPSESWS